MKMWCVLLACLGMSAPVWADGYSSYTKEELRKLCQFQKQSLQKKNHGTPACEALKKRG